MRNTAQLGLEFYNWWSRRLQGYNLGHYKPNYLERAGGLVLVRFLDKVTIAGFEDLFPERQDSQKILVVNHPSLDNSKIDILNADVENAYRNLDRSSKRIYDSIFDRRPVFSVGNVVFNGDAYNGPTARVSLKRIPEGKTGGLSDNLFVYATKIFIAPAHKISYKKDSLT